MLNLQGNGMVRKVFGYLYILVGLGITVVFGGALILQLLGIIFGLVLTFKGFKMLSPRTMNGFQQFHFFSDRQD